MPALEFNVENTIATLLLNRPEAKNALNAEISDGLEAAGQGIAGASDYAKESFRRFAAREPARFMWPASGAAQDKQEERHA